MNYELNLKLENGKIKARVSGDIELFGIRIKVKEYEVIGDFNEVLDKLADIVESKPEEAATILMDTLSKSFGLKKGAIERLKTAFMNAM